MNDAENGDRPGRRLRGGRATELPSGQVKDVAQSDTTQNFAGDAIVPAKPQNSGVLQDREIGPKRNGELWTRWRPRNYAPRSTMFIPAEHVPTVFALTAGLSGFVRAPLRVMLVGKLPFSGIGGTTSWAGGPLADGWTVSDKGHYVDGAHPTLRYVVDGSEVEVSSAAAWFGGGDYTASDCGAVWEHLAAALGRRWDGAQMLSTPATLGRDLFVRSLGDREFPVMSMELQELIRSTSGQGRIEIMPAPWRDAKVPRLVEYDGRMMYAGCVRELGYGMPKRDCRIEFDPHARGRYRVRFEVPAGWNHVGMLAVHDEDGGWWYPSEPGWTGTTWADGAELQLAWLNGWRWTILERIIWPEQAADPLGPWARDLVALIDQAPEEWSDGERAMLRSAVRAIVLHSIGAFHGRPHKVSRSSADAPPAGARNVTIDPATGRYHWTEGDRQAWPELAHPEWSAAVWARARARLLSCPTGRRESPAGMLDVNVQTIVGVRTDAIYMTGDPDWHDDGKVGRLTLRLDVDAGGANWPTSNAELVRLRNELAT